MKPPRFWFLILLAVLLVGCAGQGAGVAQPQATAVNEATESVTSTTLTVFAAASLTEAFTELGTQFEAENPGVKVIFNFAGSQQLAQQLTEGAPADVFASANQKQMGVATTAGRVNENEQKIFAHNRLVAIYPKDNPGDVQSLQDLTKPGLSLVLADKDVPVGQYSQDFLDKANEDPAYGATYKEDVLKNVVSFEQTVKAVLTKIVLGEGDAGIVYLTDIGQDQADKVTKIDIPDALNTIADYPIAPVNDSKQQELANTFIEFVLSPAAGQQILEKYGFVPVAAE